MTAVPAVLRAPARHAPWQWLALWVAVATIVAGVAGAVVSPRHAVVHLAIGAVGVALWSSPSSARTFGWLLVGGYAAAFLYGLYAMGDPDLDVLSLRDADNLFHVASAALGAVIAGWPDD
jgi:hypothetical protein